MCALPGVCIMNVVCLCCVEGGGEGWGGVGVTLR